MKLTRFALIVAVVLSPAALFAQTAPTPAPQTVNGRTIAERKTDQQQRIAQGVRSGQLTARETRNLETKERGINHEERAMRTLDNGKLTKADKRVLTHQQNAVSRKIYNKKHNGRVRG